MNCPRCKLELHKCASEGTDIDLNQIMEIGKEWPNKIICTIKFRYICINPACNNVAVTTTERKDYTLSERKE